MFFFARVHWGFRLPTIQRFLAIPSQISRFYYLLGANTTIQIEDDLTEILKFLFKFTNRKIIPILSFQTPEIKLAELKLRLTGYT